MTGVEWKCNDNLSEIQHWPAGSCCHRALASYKATSPNLGRLENMHGRGHKDARCCINLSNCALVYSTGDLVVSIRTRLFPLDYDNYKTGVCSSWVMSPVKASTRHILNLQLIHAGTDVHSSCARHLWLTFERSSRIRWIEGSRHM